MALTAAQRQARYKAKHGLVPRLKREAAHRLAANWVRDNYPDKWAEIQAEADALVDDRRSG